MPNTESGPTTVMAFRVPTEHAQQLRTIAKLTEMPVSKVIQTAVNSYLVPPAEDATG